MVLPTMDPQCRVMSGTGGGKAWVVGEGEHPSRRRGREKMMGVGGNLALVTGRGREGKSIAVPFLPARVNAALPTPQRWHVQRAAPWVGGLG